VTQAPLPGTRFVYGAGSVAGPSVRQVVRVAEGMCGITWVESVEVDGHPRRTWMSMPLEDWDEAYGSRRRSDA
jgi:hypothetical protein